MIPIQLVIKGIGPHSHTILNFSELKSPVGMVAPKGTGKTTLLECLLAALYGDYAWYGSNIYGLLTQGGSGKAEIQLTFDEGGEVYTVTRTLRATAATKSHVATLVDAEGKTIAGPKVADCNRAIENIVGSKENALATWFCAQNRRMDLCGSPGEPDLRSRRRRIFGHFVNVDKLDVPLKIATEEAKHVNGRIAELTAQLADQDDPTDEIESLEQSIETDNAMRENDRENLQHEQTQLEEARTALRDAQAGDAQLQAKIDSFDAAARVLSAAEHERDGIPDRIEKHEAIAEGYDQAKTQAQEFEEKAVERTRLKTEQAHFVNRQNWERVESRLSTRVKMEEDAIATLEAVPGVDAATVALAGTLEKITSEGILAKATNEDRVLWNKERDEQLQKIGKQAAAMESRIKDIGERLDKKPETLFGEKCADCPFLAEYKDLPDELAARKKALVQLCDQGLAIDPPEELIDLAELRAKYEQALNATKAVEGARETTEKLARRRSDLAAIKQEHKDHMGLTHHAVGEVADRSDAIEKVQTCMDALAGADERLALCGASRVQVAGLREDLRLAQAIADEAKANYAAKLPASESAKKALADLEGQRDGIKAAGRIALEASLNTQASIDELTQKIADKNARINSLNDQLAATQAKRDRLNEQGDYAEGLRDLRTVFGPAGVRQIIVDSKAKELEDIANDLFVKATDGAMHLRIATQTALADGSLAEDFAIMVRDARGERDVTEHSGGELQLCQILFRIAVAVWLGRQLDRPPETLILDEAFDRLGSDGVEELMGVIEWLNDQINVMVLVTHDPNIADRLASKVTLAKHISGVEVIENDRN